MKPDELAALVEKMTEGPWVQMSGKYMSVDRGETPQVFRAIYDDDERGIMALRNLAPVLLAAWRWADAHRLLGESAPDLNDGDSMAAHRRLAFAVLDAERAYRAAVAAQEGK